MKGTIKVLQHSGPHFTTHFTWAGDVMTAGEQGVSHVQGQQEPESGLGRHFQPLASPH
jgi:hypothetical protein